MKYFPAVAALFAVGAFAVALPPAVRSTESSAGYYLNLTLVTEGDTQYWLLTDDNVPEAVKATPPWRTTESGSQPAPPWRSTDSGSQPAPPWRRAESDSQAGPPWRTTESGSQPAPPWRETESGSQAAPPWRSSESDSQAATPWRTTETGSQPAPPWRRAEPDSQVASPWRESESGSQPAPPWRRAAPVEARDTPVCDGSLSRQANTDDCSQLLAALSNDLNLLPSTPRAIRYINCYTSWSKEVSGVRAELYGGALDILNTCDSNGWVSGLKKNVKIDGKQLTQCLSNRLGNCL